ncbi:patatin-like phospholipase family protein [Rhizobium sp. SL86]|uniref:patatin-like phospholipase family protein n=1 Tax=Rhizobium sp. SL86 TaxID=2995148 RepID=UPI0022759B21|nr:patatin-like phospholipase family protein [Rhizobium sp. SL86]MCY1664575.1 patatin-like phospholipase family protein [Rhizobium sp. SL86]
MRSTQNILVFQGGGALGAYQAGTFEALHRHGIEPDWLAGISIGAINSAIIAGSAPDQRVRNLRDFWDMVSSGLDYGFVPDDHLGKRMMKDWSVLAGSMTGVPGFFSPRLPTPYQMLLNPDYRISHYDTEPLIKTLDRLVDFDRIHHGNIRVSLGAVNVKTGNFAYFDTRKTKLRAQHVAASGALPPGFPPIEIDGEYYWDGGLVSNTPLQYVLGADHSDADLCIFQVDLFSARGCMPRDMLEVDARVKEIRYSSRTRMNTDEFARKQIVRRAARRLLDKLPPELRDDEDVALLRSIGLEYDVTIVHLIHRTAAYDSHAMDAEFSRATVEENWKAGYDDAVRTLTHPKWTRRGRPKNGIQIFDLAQDNERDRDEATETAPARPARRSA